MSLDDLQLLEELQRESQEPPRVRQQQEEECKQQPTLSASARPMTVQRQQQQQLLSSSMHEAHRITTTITPLQQHHTHSVEVAEASAVPAIIVGRSQPELSAPSAESASRTAVAPARPLSYPSHHDFSSKLTAQTTQVISNSQQLLTLQERIETIQGSDQEEKKKFEQAIVPLVRRSAERADTVLKGTLRRTSLELNGAVLTLQRQLIAERQKHQRQTEHRRMLEAASEIAQRDAAAAKAHAASLEDQLRTLTQKSYQQTKYILEFETRMGVGGAEAEPLMQARKKVVQLNGHLAAANEETKVAREEAQKAMLTAEEQRAYIDVLKRALELRVSDINKQLGSGSSNQPPRSQWDENPHPSSSINATSTSKKDRVLDGQSSRSASTSGAVLPLHITKYSLVELAARSCKVQMEAQLQQAVKEKNATVTAMKQMEAKYQQKYQERVRAGGSRKRENSTEQKRGRSTTRSLSRSPSRSPSGPRRTLSRSPSRARRSPSASPTRNGAVEEQGKRVSRRTTSTERRGAPERSRSPTSKRISSSSTSHDFKAEPHSSESHLPSDASKESVLLSKARSLEASWAARLKAMEKEHRKVEKMWQRRLDDTIQEQSASAARITAEYRQRVEVTLSQLQAEQSEKAKLLDFVEELTHRAAQLDLAAGEARVERDMWEMQARELAGVVEEQGNHAQAGQQQAQTPSRRSQSQQSQQPTSADSDVKDDVISTLEHQVSVLAQKLSGSEAECDGLDARCCELENELARVRNIAAKEHAEVFSPKRGGVQAAVTTPSRAASRLSASTSGAMDDRSLAVRLAGLEEELRGVHLQRDTLHSQFMSLQIAHNTLTNELARATADLQARTAEYDNLAGQYAFVQNEKLDQARQIASLQQDLSSLSTSHSHALSTAHSSLHAVRHELISKHGEELARVRAEWEQERREWEQGIQKSLHQQISSLKSSAHSTEAAHAHDLALAKHKSEEAERREEKAVQARKQAEEELREGRETLTELRRVHEDAMHQQRAQWESLLRNETDQTKALEDRLEKEKSTNSLLSSRLRAHEETIHALKSDLSQAHTDSLRPQEDIARLRGEQEEWKRKATQQAGRVEEYAHALSVMEAQLAEYKLDVESEHQTLKANLDAAAKRAAQAEIQMERAHSELDSLRHISQLEKSDVSTALQRVKEESFSKESALQERRFQLAAAEKQLNECKRQLQEAQFELDRSKKSLSDQSLLLREKDRDLGTLRARLEARSLGERTRDVGEPTGTCQAASAMSAVPTSGAAAFRASMAAKEREERQMTGRDRVNEPSMSTLPMTIASPARKSGFTASATTVTVDATYSTGSAAGAGGSSLMPPSSRPTNKIDERLRQIQATFANLKRTR